MPVATQLLPAPGASAPVPRRAAALSRRSRLALLALPALAATVAAGVVGTVIDRPLAGPPDTPVRLDEIGLRSGVAPSLELPALEAGGSAVSLAVLRGTPVVVNFFSSTCVPCRTELPMLQAAAARSAGRVAFVGVDSLDRAPAARALVRATGVRFPVGFDAEGAAALRYQVPALPATFFVKADGTIGDRVLGPLTPSTLRSRLATLVAGSAPRPLSGPSS